MVRTLGLTFVPTSVEDRFNLLLAEGMVSGDVKQVAGGTGLQVAKLVDQGLVGRPEEECADDVHVNDIREGVASLGKPTNVVLLGLAGLLLTALEVPGVTRAAIRPLEVRLVANAVVREEFKPCLNMFPHVDGEILNDEMVIIHPSGSVGEPEIFEPNA